ncbi:lipoprotein signal peptidase [Exilibacterium tricleocarpae]|uniref:Lipoprotein signal peptidase n=1 Tax=Exilibacterium tricleocarpae TaxID=2591008 RepID=A0A545T1W0_9GAMM|nr:signal peptidase II [Exilibacterium tricleocarpae]TQV71193.1 lipoprotein signal peptidase [Exilibacterium tricleocarpae]
MSVIGRHALLWYAIALVVVVLDQWSKAWISANFIYGEPRVFTSFFNFTRLHNTGAAFSFLSEAGGWQRWFFSVIAFGVSAAIVVWIARLPASQRWEAAALALVLGGAIGNLYDRIALGYVVDFIVFHYEHYYFPAFNVADMAISTGAFMLIVDMLFFKHETEPDPESETQPEPKREPKHEKSYD